MSLPKLKIPTFTETLPLSKIKVKFRPFLSSEEKVLLILNEGKDVNEIIEGIKELVNVCSFGKLKSEDLPIADVEWFFLKLREKSIGSEIELSMKCSCGAKNSLTLDLKNVKPPVVDVSQAARTIMITDEVGIILKQPTLEIVDMIENRELKENEILPFLIEFVFDKSNSEEMIRMKDEPKEEVEEFINSWSINKRKEVSEYFKDVPTIKHDIEFVCTKCQENNKVELRGLSDFFM